MVATLDYRLLLPLYSLCGCRKKRLNSKLIRITSLQREEKLKIIEVLEKPLFSSRRFDAIDDDDKHNKYVTLTNDSVWFNYLNM